LSNFPNSLFEIFYTTVVKVVKQRWRGRSSDGDTNDCWLLSVRTRAWRWRWRRVAQSASDVRQSEDRLASITTRGAHQLARRRSDCLPATWRRRDAHPVRSLSSTDDGLLFCATAAAEQSIPSPRRSSPSTAVGHRLSSGRAGCRRTVRSFVSQHSVPVRPCRRLIACMPSKSHCSSLCDSLESVGTGVRSGQDIARFSRMLSLVMMMQIASWAVIYSTSKSRRSEVVCVLVPQMWPLDHYHYCFNGTMTHHIEQYKSKVHVVRTVNE